MGAASRKALCPASFNRKAVAWNNSGTDGLQVNAVFRPSGLRSFRAEWKDCRLAKLENVPVRVLPLERVIASKRAAGREKDLAVLPILERTLRLARHLKKRVSPISNRPPKITRS